MIQTPEHSATPKQFDDWLKQEILSLSVDALNQAVFTWTACSPIDDYMIDSPDKHFRLPSAQAYALLQYIQHNTAT